VRGALTMTESTSSQARIVLALWFIAIIYILSLDLKGIWTDEGNRYRLLAGGQTWQQYNQSHSFGTSSQVIAAVGATSQYFPLFYLIDNAVIRLAKSHSDLLLRLVNVLWLMLSLQGLLRFFRNYAEPTRLFAMAIFALNGFLMMHVMQIREYPLYLALLIWSSCLLFEILELPAGVSWLRTWSLLIGYGILMGLFFYTQPYSVFALAAQLTMLLTVKTSRPAIFRLLRSYAIAAVMIAPWIIMRLRTGVNVGLWDARAPTLALLWEGLKTGFGSLLIYQSWTGHPLLQAFVAVIVIGIPAAWILEARLGTPMDPRALYALLTAAFFFVFQLLYFFFDQPLSLWFRYFIAYDLAFVVLASCAFSSFYNYAAKQKRGYWKVFPAALLLFVFVVGLQQVRLFRQNPFMDTSMSAACNWRAIALAMLGHVKPEETVVYYSPLLAWTLGVAYPLFPNELSFSDVKNPSQISGKHVLWMLDTGVVRDYTKQTLETLQSAKYSITRTAELGCQCRLYRLELRDGEATGSEPARGVQ